MQYGQIYNIYDRNKKSYKTIGFLCLLCIVIVEIIFGKRNISIFKYLVETEYILNKQ